MHKAIIKARSLARRTGLKRLYYRFFPQGSYEEKLHSEISAELRPGDLIWDIGANLGLYTKMFAQRTGNTGRVFAFEPVPSTFEQLCRETRDYPWVQNEQIALSDFDGVCRLLVGESDTVGHLENFAGETITGTSVDVPVMCGNSYWKKTGMTPNLLKIDVEGFEEEVLNGMKSLLAAPELRAVFLEVHFEILESRGRSDAPLRIEKLLHTKGLFPRWVDYSHIVAKREVRRSPSVFH
jgi:FkbM family methyltransferase